MKQRRAAKIITLIVSDFLLLYGGLIVALWVRYGADIAGHLIVRHLAPFTLVFGAWVIVFAAFGLYDLRFAKNSKRFLYRLIQTMVSNTVVGIIIFYLIPFAIEPRRNLFLTVFFSTLFIFLARWTINSLLVRTPSNQILFLGITNEAIDLAKYLLQNPQLGQKPAAFMAVETDDVKSFKEISDSSLSLPSFTSNQKLESIIRRHAIDTIVILGEIKENKTLVKLLFAVLPLGVSVVEFSAFFETTTGKIPSSLIGEVWFLENLIGGKKRLYEFFKRMLDLMVAALLIMPTLLLFPIIAFAIRLDSKGPIFFRQKRVGRNGSIFQVIKFRSMVNNAERMSGFKGSGPDPRHTRIGTMLRKSYIDELPQIINILKGEMSFVGPRPERPEYVGQLKRMIPFYEMRLLVTPGITGWAQVNMENDASVEDAPEKIQYDLYYVKNRNLILDLLIIFRTFSTVIQRQGR